MPGMTRPATTGQKEDALLARPRQAALLTAGVLALTAVVFALVADHRCRPCRLVPGAGYRSAPVSRSPRR